MQLCPTALWTAGKGGETAGPVPGEKELPSFPPEIQKIIDRKVQETPPLLSHSTSELEMNIQGRALTSNKEHMH